MKKLFLITALVAFFGSLAHGQFLSPSAQRGSALAIPSGGYKIDVATATTNIANPPPFPVLSGGLSLYCLAGATNQTFSNLYFRVQFSPDSVTWFGATGGALTNDSGTGQQVFIPMDKIGANHMWTNFVASTATLGVKWARLHSISNSAFAGGVLSNNVWITNLYFITQEQ